MMMKKLFALALACCLALTVLPFAGAAEDTILPERRLAVLSSNDPIVEAALRVLMQNHPELMPERDVTVCNANAVALSDGTQANMVSVFCQNDWPLLYAVITLDAITGAVIRYEETDLGWFYDAQALWETAYGPYGKWPLDKQVLYDILYCVEIDHALPPEGSITELEAFDLAVAAAGLAGRPSALTYERSLVLNAYAADPTETYIWLIILYQSGCEVAQVDLSAQDGHIVHVFLNESDLG